MTDLLPLFDHPEGVPQKKRCVFNEEQIASAFERLWQVRPKRVGSNPKPPVQKKFTAMVKAGENPETIIAGVRQLRDYYERNGGVTRFVPMMSTIINNRRWEGDLHDEPVATGGSSFIDMAVELHGAGSRNDPDPNPGGRFPRGA